MNGRPLSSLRAFEAWPNSRTRGPQRRFKITLGCIPVLALHLPPVATPQPLAAEKRIEDPHRRSALRSVAKVGKDGVTAGQLIPDRNRMLTVDAPGERCV